MGFQELLTIRSRLFIEFLNLKEMNFVSNQQLISIKKDFLQGKRLSKLVRNNILIWNNENENAI